MVDFIDQRLVRLPKLNGWLEMLLIALVNVAIYFFVGWALDAIINRYPAVQQSNAL